MSYSNIYSIKYKLEPSDNSDVVLVPNFVSNTDSTRA